MTKIEFWLDEMNPARTGWYINDYNKFEEPPHTSTGPYETQTQAIRMLRETTETKGERANAGHQD